ncbi:hypothetical protein B599_0684 [Chlamydia psittaci MN]|nr:hypothetical protein B599_0684 [Chlamydia psittaci MN]
MQNIWSYFLLQVCRTIASEKWQYAKLPMVSKKDMPLYSHSR